MEKNLHDIHRERVNKPRWKDEYPAHIMSVEELREYRSLLHQHTRYTDEQAIRIGELQVKYRQLRRWYQTDGRTDEQYFEITRSI